MSPWDAAASSIAAAFADPEMVAYHRAGGVVLHLSAIRVEADLTAGGERLSYEIRASDLPGTPSKQDHLVAGARVLRVIKVPCEPNPAGGWLLGVADDGPAA